MRGIGRVAALAVLATLIGASAAQADYLEDFSKVDFYNDVVNGIIPIGSLTEQQKIGYDIYTHLSSYDRDAILAKWRKSGFDSLTQAEKNFVQYDQSRTSFSGVPCSNYCKSLNPADQAKFLALPEASREEAEQHWLYTGGNTGDRLYIPKAEAQTPPPKVAELFKAPRTPRTPLVLQLPRFAPPALVLPRFDRTRGDIAPLVRMPPMALPPQPEQSYGVGGMPPTLAPPQALTLPKSLQDRIRNAKGL